LPVKTYTFGRCIALLGVDAKVFRRWVRKDLGLGEKDQVSRADSRVRYLTREQVEKLAELHEKTLPPDDQMEDGEEEHLSPGAYKLLIDRVMMVEQVMEVGRDALSSSLSEMTNFASQISHLQDLLEHSTSESATRLDTLEQQHTQSMAQIEQRLIEIESRREPASAANKVPPSPEQHLAEVEARYQQRIAELEAQLAAATHKQQPAAAPPKKKPARKKRKPPLKALPSTLVARNSFAALHNVSEKLVSKASLEGKIATVEGKWLSHDHAVVTRALNDRGKHDFYQVFSQRPYFHPCEQCPHDLSDRI
jgi:hypothetical protein